MAWIYSVATRDFSKFSKKKKKKNVVLPSGQGCSLFSVLVFTTTTSELLTMLNECQNCDSGPTLTAPRNSKRGLKPRRATRARNFLQVWSSCIFGCKMQGDPQIRWEYYLDGAVILYLHSPSVVTVCMPMKCEAFALLFLRSKNNINGAAGKKFRVQCKNVASNEPFCRAKKE